MHEAEDHQTEARLEAVRRVRARLADADLGVCADRGGLDARSDGSVVAVLLGRELRIQPGLLDVVAVDGRRVSPVDQLLVLRYLEAEWEVKPTGESISFRNLPGGAFYNAALAKRTTQLVLGAFADDSERLRRALERFPCEPLDIGDVGATIHAIGRLDVGFVYRMGDAEFPASADIFYDRIVASVYSTEEIAALTTNLCVGLVRSSKSGNT